MRDYKTIKEMIEALDCYPDNFSWRELKKTAINLNLSIKTLKSKLKTYHRKVWEHTYGIEFDKIYFSIADTREVLLDRKSSRAVKKQALKSLQNVFGNDIAALSRIKATLKFLDTLYVDKYRIHVKALLEYCEYLQIKNNPYGKLHY